MVIGPVRTSTRAPIIKQRLIPRHRIGYNIIINRCLPPRSVIP